MENETAGITTNWRQTEWEQEKRFSELGPFHHLYTEPQESTILFMTEHERCMALVYMAIAAVQCCVEIMAYALMSNHFHFVLKGDAPACLSFFSSFRQRLCTYFSRHGRVGEIVELNAKIKEISSLKQFRDEVAYVIRNPYVVRRDVNPLAYEWTSGFLYFNPMLRLLNPIPVQSLTVKQKRELTSSKDISFLDGLSVLGDYPYPGSFVNFRLVESLFQDARQFTMCLFKNMEAQVETALQLGERPSLTDDDLLPVSLRLCKELSGSNRLSNLSEAHKLQLAKRLKYDYYASNKQVARFSGLPLARVNALFPLAAPSPGKTRP